MPNQAENDRDRKPAGPVTAPFRMDQRQLVILSLLLRPDTETKRLGS
jgi:hypothetical protein